MRARVRTHTHTHRRSVSWEQRQACHCHSELAHPPVIPTEGGQKQRIKEWEWGGGNQQHSSLYLLNPWSPSL